jgi:hypothetical protein
MNNRFKKISLLSAFLVLFVLRPTLAQQIYEMPDRVETRWASGENPNGEKGRGGKSTADEKAHRPSPLKRASHAF